MFYPPPLVCFEKSVKIELLKLTFQHTFLLGNADSKHHPHTQRSRFVWRKRASCEWVSERERESDTHSEKCLKFNWITAWVRIQSSNINNLLFTFKNKSRHAISLSSGEFRQKHTKRYHERERIKIDIIIFNCVQHFYSFLSFPLKNTSQIVHIHYDSISLSTFACIIPSSVCVCVCVKRREGREKIV